MINTAIQNQNWYGKIFDELGNFKEIKDKSITFEERSLNSICQKLKTPTKIFWGKHDTLFPYQTAHFLHRQIDDSQVCIFENTGHCPHLEDPKQFSLKLIDFIGKIDE